MSRLYMIVEGQAEQAFAARLLIPFLAERGVFAHAELPITGRKRSRTYHGGVINYERTMAHIVRRLREDRSREASFTTMIDLYGLPRSFPGSDRAAQCRDPFERVAILEAHLADDVGDSRFIPYIQLYEFEALLLTSPTEFEAAFPDRQQAIANLVALVDQFESPEHIDDGNETAPSKRIGKELPAYLGAKPTAAPAIAEAIGLDTIRTKCRHFREWLDRLTKLGESG